jgi:hypothetical protein
MRGTPEQRFWDKVALPDANGCLLWTAGRTGGKGYGSFWPTPARSVPAHQFAYELLVGPVPEGLELDHLCRVRACVAVAHLEPVTHQENVRRGDLPRVASQAGRDRTRCKWGHEYTPENTYYPPCGTRPRQCRACRRVRTARSARQRRAQT